MNSSTKVDQSPEPIGYNPTIRLDLVPLGVMPLTGCLLGAVPPSLITSLSRHARAVS
jgi:hypothetical protein